MIRRSSLVAAAAVALSAIASAQSPAPSPSPSAPPLPPGFPTPEERKRIQEESDVDHKDMLAQLGIKALRPGADGRPEAAGSATAANYDEAKANTYRDYPDALVLKNGRRVTTPAAWWKERRPEIVEDFEREVIGRVPPNVPKVTWTVAERVQRAVGGIPVVAKRVVGHVDNSQAPDVDVNIRMIVVTPADAKGPVPVLMMFVFGFVDLPLAAGASPPPPPPWLANATFKDPPSEQQLIAAGWGYAALEPISVQADNGAGLTKGIIGLVNKGKRRKPEDWGSLRAWAWGAARALDYLETDPAVDAKHVGIEGVSRFGKAALVTMAFEPRFAIVLIGSSGEGGTKPHRRTYGEIVENLTGAGEYHWMSGSFIKYGAAESVFGSKNAGDIPVDANELIALCAPRPTFISYGIPESGDSKWLDQQGSYMAAVAAGPVFRLLGAKDLGVKDDYHTAVMPPQGTLLGGELAWRQHDGGHEDRSNMKYFLAWAEKYVRPSGVTARRR